MNKYQTWLIVSIAILVVALAMPIYVLYSELGATLRRAANTIPNYDASNPATGGIDTFVQAQQAAQTGLLLVVLVAEIVLVGCFTATLWYAIKCRDRCRNYPPPA